MLEVVDWQGLFSTFYEIPRMKIKYKDPTKIPKERLFHIDKKLYKIAITAEMPKETACFQGGSRGDDDDKGDDNGGTKITLMM